MTEFLIKQGRIGCVPGVDFGPAGEGHVRFCFARDRAELTGALEQMARNPEVTRNKSFVAHGSCDVRSLCRTC